jgi:hypothetical protein
MDHGSQAARFLLAAMQRVITTQGRGDSHVAPLGFNVKELVSTSSSLEN